MKITEPAGLTGLKGAAAGFYATLFAVPFIGSLSQQAIYVLLLIALFIFAVDQKRYRWLLVSIPVLISVVGIIFAPVIQGHPRYAFPFIYATPLMLAYYIHLGGFKKDSRKPVKKKRGKLQP